MRACVLFSGGKDSCFALHLAMLHGLEIYVLTIVPKNEDDEIFHYPNVRLTRLQTKQMKIPEERHFFIEMDDCFNYTEIENFLLSKKIDILYTGGIESDYQRFYFYLLSHEVNICIKNPLWLKKELNSEYYQDLSNHFSFVLTKVAAMDLTEEYMKSVFDMNMFRKSLESKKLIIHPYFEGGEAETFVVDCPFFEKRLEITDYEILKEKQSAVLLIKSIREVSK